MKRKLVLIVVSIIILLTLFPAPVAAEEGYFRSNPVYIYLGQWVWDPLYHNGMWRLPPTALGSLDLRSIPQMSQRGGQSGYGLFFCTDPVAIDGYMFLGNDFNLELPLQITRFVEQNWNINLSSYTTNGTIWEMFVEEGDPTGLLRWKPLVAEIDGTLVININGFSPVTFAKDAKRYGYEKNDKPKKKDWQKPKHPGWHKGWR